MKKHIYSSILLVSMLALTGCGGGGDGGNGNNNRSGSPIIDASNLPELDGLTGDADNQGRLYYTTTGIGFIPRSGMPDLEMEKITLWVVDPVHPESPRVIEDNMSAQVVDFGFLPIHKATIGADSRSVSDFQIDRVVYASDTLLSDPASPDMGSIQRVSTDPSILMAALEPKQTSSDTSGDPFSAPRRLLQHSLGNPDDTALAYTTDQQDGLLLGWKQIRLGDDEHTDPISFHPQYQVVSSVKTEGAALPGGWLVIDHSSEGALRQVDFNGKNPSDVRDDNGRPIKNLKFVNPLAGEHLDGSQLLVLTFEDDNTSSGDEQEDLQGELWYFKRNDNPALPGTARLLTNKDGEKLLFNMSFNIMAPGAAVPADNYLTQVGGNTFFFQQPLPLIEHGAKLYRADENGWEKLLGETIGIENIFDPDFDHDVELEDGGSLIAVGEYVIWATEDELKGWHIPTGRLEILDDYTRYNSSSIPRVHPELSMPVLGSRDGWIFYNRTLNDTSKLTSTQYAVAMQIGGAASEINIANARWVGASSNGNSTNSSQISRMELSEVFLLKDNGDLGAVSAANPAGGMVPLGQLGNVDNVYMYGLSPGPHRLLQVESGRESEYEVIYVNTREKNSLVRLMNNKGDNGWNRPVPGF